MKSKFSYLYNEVPYTSDSDKKIYEDHLDQNLRRFTYSFDLIAPYKPKSVLDVGPHTFTRIMRHEWADCTVDQLAILSQAEYENLFGNISIRPGERHFVFDLDTSYDRSKWPTIPPHDIVTLCEVCEHLHTSPNHWLPFLRTCIKPDGLLLITTPNGVALRRRLQMILGINPQEKIRYNPNHPGHFREYTAREIIDYAQENGFKLLHVSHKAHIDYNANKSGMCVLHSYPQKLLKLYNLVTSCLPPTFRDQMYFLFQVDPAFTPKTRSKHEVDHGF